MDLWIASPDISRLEIPAPVVRTSAMAWRIDESVIRGEIDNRQKGIVRGKVWLDGLPEPVVLELEGNAHADLAGCLLTFTNPGAILPMPKDAMFTLVQRGKIGDLTASRKVRVLEVPIELALEMSRRGEKPPEHMANSLYLEWFSFTNGRVVIESADYVLEISAPAWRLTAEDEEQRQRQATEGWAQFLSQLDQAVTQHTEQAKDPEEQWDEHDYERFLRECDARTNKYSELLDKYGDSEEAHELIDKEMGWAEELTEEEAEEERKRIEEINAACEEALNEPPPEPDPAREGIDWIRTEGGKIVHPLQHRCSEAAMGFARACKEAWLNMEDEQLGDFIFAYRTVGVKLAGALNTIANDRSLRDPAFTVAYLKRALGHLHNAQGSLETLAAAQSERPEGQRVPDSMISCARKDLFEIREELLRLMQRYREEAQ